MKTTKIFLASLFTLLSITLVSAQYGNNGYGGGGYGGNGYGSGNGMSQMGGMNQRSQPEKPKEIPPEESAAKIMEDMKPAINLDELQTIAISNVIVESLKTEGRILKQDTTQDEQIKDFKLLSENTDRKIMDFLNKDQKEKYLVFKEEIKNQKKSKFRGKKK
jgi:hypothetical protein